MFADQIQSSRVLHLPSSGVLLVCTDLHGNLRDFRRMVSLFRQSEDRGERPFLLFTGDLIHGPNAQQQEWPSYLGSFYNDESPELVEEFLQLQRNHPSQVACLLGNHEHSHVGGPHTPKFWTDETAFFEQSVGAERVARCREAFDRFPLVALSACGIAACHAAPNVNIRSASDLEVSYAGFESWDINAMYTGPNLCRLLWSRHCPAKTARAFLDALSTADTPLSIVVFGHDIVSDGYQLIGEEQLQLSSSFGMRDSHKTYLRVDLAARYRNVKELSPGRELCLLWD